MGKGGNCIAILLVITVVFDIQLTLDINHDFNVISLVMAALLININTS